MNSEAVSISGAPLLPLCPHLSISSCWYGVKWWPPPPSRLAYPPTPPPTSRAPHLPFSPDFVRSLFFFNSCSLSRFVFLDYAIFFNVSFIFIFIFLYPPSFSDWRPFNISSTAHFTFFFFFLLKLYTFRAYISLPANTFNTGFLFYSSI